MKLLLDTHLLIWTAADMLPGAAAEYIFDKSNELFFSSLSIWEIVIKRKFERNDFKIDPYLLHSKLLDNGYNEMRINSGHALLIVTLPLLHKDPFDRMLLAQSIAEGIPLLTADRILAQYPAPVIYVKR